MSKPIFIVRFPVVPNVDKYEGIYQFLEKKLREDYHVICFMNSSTEEVQFECYNANNAADKDIEEIKQMVLKQIESYE